MSVQNPEDARYKHAVEATPWAVRRIALQVQLARLAQAADVFAFQESDFALFHQDFAPWLAELGFAGVHQWDGCLKHDQPPHPWGVAVAYRSDRFTMGFKETRSRGMVVGLCKVGLPAAAVPASSPAPDWFIANVHLEASSNKVTQQLKQLHGTINKLSTHALLNPASARVIVCGDFNSTVSELPMQWLLQGALPGPDAVVSAHAFHFVSALDLLGLDPKTYADPEVAFRVDHIAFTADSMELLGCLRVPEERRPIFGTDFPSDHFPVGALLREKPVELAPVPLVRDPDWCPLTPGQLRVFYFLQDGAPVKKSKGKPSAKKLASIRAHQNQMDAFTAHLTPEGKTWAEGWKKRARKRTAHAKPAAAAADDSAVDSAPKPAGARRSMSLTMPKGAYMTLQQLFDVLPMGAEDETAPAASSAAVLPAAPPLQKRRFTLFAQRAVSYE
jgi:hypothetical protein